MRVLERIRVPVGIVAACAVLAAGLALADSGPLTAEERGAVDRRAAMCPTEAPRAAQRQFYGSLAALTVAQVPLSAEEEFARATALHERLLADVATIADPGPASEVLADLAAELPDHLVPWGHGYVLTVVERPGQEAFTFGGGYLYLTRDYLEALTRDDVGARDRLAFAIAVEMGHNARGHCRRGYQWLALQEELDERALDEIDRDAVRGLVEHCLAFSGGLITHLYDAQQVAEAELFAVHLCRNAGFDVEAGLDVLRREALEGEAAGAEALRRLKSLREELDGVVPNEAHGLLAWDERAGEWARLSDGALVGLDRGVVFVHGLKSNLGTWDALRAFVARDDDGRNLRLLAFYYPGDASLARSGKFLARELERVGADAEGLDFVCHSAGGLVVRWYAEVEGGPLRQAVFLGTPHRGSDLARLRPLLELRQIVGDLDLGYSEALERAILDGNGQIACDLQPESLFLRYLDRAEGQPERYSIFRGRVIGRKRATAIRAGLVAARVTLRRLLDEEGLDGRLRLAAERWIEQLRLPAEVSRGDLVVTLDSAALEGAARVETYELHHIALTCDVEVMQRVTALLVDRPLPERANEAGNGSRWLRRLLSAD